MKSVVLGGFGFIGLNLVSVLSERNDDITVIDRRDPAARPKRVRFVRGDYLEVSLAEELKGADCVFHLAGPVDLTAINADPSLDARHSIVDTVRLLDACLSAGVKRVVFASSGGAVYGEPKTLPIDEEHPTMPISAYGVSKLTVEKYLHVYKKTRGLDYKIARFANLYGEHQSPFRRQGIVPVLLHKALNGEAVEIWGKGDVVRDYVHVGDAARAMAAMSAHRGGADIFNVGSGSGVSVKELVESVADTVGKKIRVVHKEPRAFDVPACVLDCSLAEKELGWTPKTALKPGLERTCRWMKDVMGKGWD